MTESYPNAVVDELDERSNEVPEVGPGIIGTNNKGPLARAESSNIEKIERLNDQPDISIKDPTPHYESHSTRGGSGIRGNIGNPLPTVDRALQRISS